MSDTQVIIATGKKQSGKDSICAYLIEYLLKLEPSYEYITHSNGSQTVEKIQYKTYKINGKMAKIYSFADPLKRFLIDVMGLSEEQCYGTDAQKNTITHLSWASLPMSSIEINRIQQDLKSKNIEYMTAREVMQIFGSNICRSMYNDCWVNAAINQIRKEQPTYALIADARFPNELEKFLSFDKPPIIIKLLRDPYGSTGHISEDALNNYNFQKFPKFIEIDNRNMTIAEKNTTVTIKLKDLL